MYIYIQYINIQTELIINYLKSITIIPIYF